MENIKFTIKVYDNCIKIVPEEGVLDNSIYDIKIKSIKSADNKKEAENLSVKVSTKISPAYCTIQDVQSLIYGCKVPDEVVLLKIREASRFVDYVRKNNPINPDDIPFEAIEFTKYKAARECLLSFSISRVTTSGDKMQLGDVHYENGAKAEDISNLLKELQAEIIFWQNALRGYGIEGRCRPKTTQRGKNAFITTPIPNSVAPINLTFERGV